MEKTEVMLFSDIKSIRIKIERKIWLLNGSHKYLKYGKSWHSFVKHLNNKKI